MYQIPIRLLLSELPAHLPGSAEWSYSTENRSVSRGKWGRIGKQHCVEHKLSFSTKRAINLFPRTCWDRSLNMADHDPLLEGNGLLSPCLPVLVPFPGSVDLEAIRPPHPLPHYTQQDIKGPAGGPQFQDFPLMVSMNPVSTIHSSRGPNCAQSVNSDTIP